MLRRFVTLGSLAGAFFMGTPAAGAAVLDLPECDADPATNFPCVVEVTKNGVAFPYNVLDGPHDEAWATRDRRDRTWWFNFNIRASGGGATLNIADRYSITINTGNVQPGETFARGEDVVVTGGLDASDHHIVTFEQSPVRMADDSCTGAGVCTRTASRTQTGYLDGWIDDLGYLDDPDDAAAMRGFDLASNIDWVSSPLELDYVTNSIFLRVANAHFESDGTTLFQGLAEFKLPFPMLRHLYHVDDPASLTASAFTVSGAGGAATTDVMVDPSGRTVHVKLDGMMFSKRTLRITGNTRPTRPKNVTADRISPTKGKIRFDPAESRGSRVREYKAYCRHRSENANLFSWRIGEDSPLVVTGLEPGRRYECTVRARSRAGYGPAARVTLRAVPN